MNFPVNKSPSEVLRRGYTDTELANIYALARLLLEGGDLGRASVVLKGVREIAPEYTPAWLASAYTAMEQGELESALAFSQRAIELEPGNVTALLYLICCLLTLGDTHSAGSYLGEVGERLSGDITDQQLLRLYRSQLARYREQRQR